MTPTCTSALEGLERLRAGNLRFLSPDTSATRANRGFKAVSNQEPFAAILGCSDSRVPLETLFDQGAGDLFVVRVAGNVVTPSTLGSVEFAAAKLGTRLVVVMGHTSCGAALATLDELRTPTQDPSPNLSAIIDRVRPAFAGLWDGNRDNIPDAELVNLAARANVRASAHQLREGSDVLADLIQEQGLLVVGAEYSLETGVVDFFEGVAPD